MRQPNNNPRTRHLGGKRRFDPRQGPPGQRFQQAPGANRFAGPDRRPRPWDRKPALPDENIGNRASPPRSPAPDEDMDLRANGNRLAEPQWARFDGFVAPHLREHKAYIPGEQPQDPGIIKLNTNENPYPPSPAVERAILKELEGGGGGLRRYPEPTSRKVREILGAQAGIAADRIVVGNGSDEILMMCVRAFGRADRPVVCAEPSYTLYSVLARSMGFPVRMMELTDPWDIPEDAPHEGSLAFLACPNAQSGTVFSSAALEAFVETFKGVVVLDEAYAEFAENDCLPLMKRSGNVILVRTLSKSHSLAGLRVGFALCGGELAGGLLKVKDSYNEDRLAQAGAAAALEDEAYLRGNVGKIKAERERLKGLLEGLGLPVGPSQANFLLVDFGGKEKAAGVLDKLREKRILVRHFPQIPRLAGSLRITVGRPEEGDGLLTALKEILS
mgnify:CR=1 FL=1